MTKTDRIAVTGWGMRCSIGRDARETFAAMVAGQTGLKPLQYFDSTRFQAQAAYEIPREAGNEPAGRATALLDAVLREAIAEAGLEDCKAGGLDCVIGTGLGELRLIERWRRDGELPGMKALSISEALMEDHPALRSARVIVNACAASLFALAAASDAIRLGDAERFAVLGVDIVVESMFGLLDRVQISPPDAVRPFDGNRRGVLMGDGAAALIIERESTALERSAPILGYVGSVGLSCDARHETAPDPAGMERAMREALGNGDASPDFIMAHGTGTSLNDAAEWAALSAVFGEQIRRLPVTAIKSMTGHTSGASGLMSVVVALLAMRGGILPPIRGHETPMAAAAGANFVVQPRPLGGARNALVNAFGFGGVNASALLERGAA